MTIPTYITISCTCFLCSLVENHEVLCHSLYNNLIKHQYSRIDNTENYRIGKFTPQHIFYDFDETPGSDIFLFQVKTNEDHLAYFIDLFGPHDSIIATTNVNAIYDDFQNFSGIPCE